MTRIIRSPPASAETPTPGIDLARTEFFRRLSPEALARVKQRLVERSFARGQALYLEGAAADRLWIVRRGRVRLYKSSPRGQVLTLDVLGPGEIFGAVSALEQPNYPSSAEAIEAGNAWVLPRELFARLLESEAQLALEVLRVVGRRLRGAEDRLRSAAQDPAPARLARALLGAAREGEAHVTRRALAESAGTTVETAIRVLRRFECEGLLRGGVGIVHLLDDPALRRRAGAG